MDAFSTTSAFTPTIGSFQQFLTGETAFYAHPDYKAKTREELASSKPLPAVYKFNTEKKIVRVVKIIFSVLVFPVGIYKLLHALVGKFALLPSSTPAICGQSKKRLDRARSDIDLDQELKFKRITLQVNGKAVDAMIVGKASTLDNGKWIVSANGNGEYYEHKFYEGSDFVEMMDHFEANALVFNYPGVPRSFGLPLRKSMAKAHRAMLTFLEDPVKGIGAKKIIGYGHSIGGAAQGEALKKHILKGGIKYLFIKSRTFSDMSTTASTLTNRFLGFLVKVFRWNMSSVSSSKKLRAPEIILQTARVRKYKRLTDSSKIVHDGIIGVKPALAKVLLDSPDCNKENKIFIGIPEGHNDSLSNIPYIVDAANELLAR